MRSLVNYRRTCGTAVVGPGERGRLGPPRVYPIDGRHQVALLADPSNGSFVWVGPVGFRGNQGWPIRPGARVNLPNGFVPSQFEIVGPADSPDPTLIVNWTIEEVK